MFFRNFFKFLFSDFYTPEGCILLSRFTNSHTHSLTQSLCHNLVHTFDQLAIVRSERKFYGMFLGWIPPGNFFVSSNFHSELFLRHVEKTMESHKKIAKMFIILHKATKFAWNVCSNDRIWSTKKNYEFLCPAAWRCLGYFSSKMSNFEFDPIFTKLKTKAVLTILKLYTNVFHKNIDQITADWWFSGKKIQFLTFIWQTSLKT